MQAWSIVVAVGLGCALAAIASADRSKATMRVADLESVRLLGEIHESDDVSGIKFRNDLLLLASDEGATVQILKRTGRWTYDTAALENLVLPLAPDEKEMDLEDIAWGTTYAFAIGSHSRKRKSVAESKKQKKNLDRLATTAIEPSRESLVRFELDADGKVKKHSVLRTSLRDLFDNHPVFQRFQDIPSKENGIDIEGLAADGDKRLYVGLRGPILRGGYVPVPILEVETAEKDGRIELEATIDKLRYVHLDGMGIRGLAKPPGDDIFILAGPMGDVPSEFRLYRWNGKNCVPGKDDKKARENVQFVSFVPLPPGLSAKERAGVKAEGLAIIDPDPERLEIVVAYDGVDGGALTRMTFERNRD